VSQAKNPTQKSKRDRSSRPRAFPPCRGLILAPTTTIETRTHPPSDRSRAPLLDSRCGPLLPPLRIFANRITSAVLWTVVCAVSW
jgi:hypothetical protein